MSVHTYTRYIENGFWDLVLGLLSKDVEAALPGKAFTANANGSEIQFDFVDTLSAGEITTLTDTVESKRGTYLGTPKPLRVSEYLPDGITVDDPRGYDYVIGLKERLHEYVVVMFRGEVREMGYYDMASVAANPDDPEQWVRVVGEFIEYTRDAMDLATSRVTTRKWYCTDGTFDSRIKVTTKRYTGMTAMDEGNRRRVNVVNYSSILILGLLAMTETGGDLHAAEVLGRAFTTLYQPQISNFIRVGDDALQVAIEADTTTTWLDNDMEPVGYPAGTTFRDVIIAEILDISDPPLPWQ